MIEDIRRLCKESLASKRLDSIYGTRERYGTFHPHFFETIEDLDDLVLPGKLPLAFTCRPSDQDILTLVQKRHPSSRIGVVARGCDERAIFELAKRFQVNLDRIEIIGVACDRAQAEECRCSRPYPRDPKFGQKLEGTDADPAVTEFLGKSLDERLAFWEYQFSKCMKCYGCRNACPMCFCKECKMEGDLHVKTGKLPVAFPVFHLIAVMHHADRCIDCGECEDACPMDIPLRLLKKIMRAEVQSLFGYEAGVDATTASPFASIERGEVSHAE